MSDRAKAIAGALIGTFAIQFVYCDRMVSAGLILAGHDELSSFRLGVFAGIAGVAGVMASGWALIPYTGPRIATFVGCGLSAIGFALGALSLDNGAPLLALAAMLAGAGVGVVLPVPASVLVRWFPERPGAVLGLSAAVGVLGVHSQFATAWSGPLVDRGSEPLESALWIFAAASLVLFLATAFLVRFPDTEGARIRVGALLRSGWLWVVVAVSAVSSCAWFWHFVDSTEFWSLGMEIVASGITAAACIVCGYLSDRLGRFPVLLTAVVLLTGLTLWHGLAPSSVSATVDHLVHGGFTDAVTVVLLAVIAVRLGPFAFPKALAVVLCTAGGARSAAEIVAGGFGEELPALACSLCAYILMLSLVMLGWYVAIRRRRSG